MMFTTLGWRQTRWKEMNGLKAYGEGRTEDISVNGMHELWESVTARLLTSTAWKIIMFAIF